MFHVSLVTIHLTQHMASATIGGVPTEEGYMFQIAYPGGALGLEG